MQSTQRTRRGPRAHALILSTLTVGSAALASTAVGSLAMGQEPVKTPKAQTSTALPRGKAAPLFELRTTGDTDWKLSDQKGKVVVLEWIDADCPAVARLHSPEGTLRLEAIRTQGDSAVQWLAIESTFQLKANLAKERAERAKAKLRIDYDVAADPTGWVGRAFGVQKAGHVAVLDGKGNVVYSGAPDDRGRGSLLGRSIDAALALEPLEVPQVPAYGCAVKYAEGVQLGAALPPMILHLEGGKRQSSPARLGRPHILQWFNPACPVVRAGFAEGGALATAHARWEGLGGAWTMVNSAPVGHASTGKANGAALKEWNIGAPVALDHGGALRDLFDIKVTPTVIATDARGVVVYLGGHTDEATKKERPLARLMDDIESAEGKPIRPRSTAAWGCNVVR